MDTLIARKDSMKIFIKITLVAALSIIYSALSAAPWHRVYYRCPNQPDVLYKTEQAAHKACGKDAYRVYYHRHHHRYYRIYDEDGQRYYVEERPGIISSTVEGAHDLASNVWHGIFG